MIQRLGRWMRFLFLSVLLFIVPVILFAAIPSAPLSGYVSDFAGVLNSEQKASLENTLSRFNASTTNEIAVVTVKSLDGDYIEHYAVELFKAWGIGTKKNNNGVLLLIAVDDHKMRIEVGYGLEGALTDSISAQIIRDDLTPAFKRSDFYGGISLAVNDIIKVTKGEYVADVSSSNTTHSGSVSGDAVLGYFMFFVVIVVNVLSFVASLFARSKSWWAGGVVGGGMGLFLTLFGFFGFTKLVGGLLISVFLAFLGCVFDYVVSNKYRQVAESGGSVPWWIGGRGFGGGGYDGGYSSSSSGSSFGGFGGGRSGGGGASGSW